MRSDPAKFDEYHAVADAHDARDPPERKPQNRIADMLKKNNRPTYSAVDLGCGRNALRSDERVSKMSWSSVDVIAADSTVTVANIGALPFEDESYDVAVLNRSLWARNHEAVLREVWRILKEGGRAILCESFRRWQSAGENTLLTSLKATGFTVLSEYGTNAESEVSDVFQYIEVRR
jgi:SAM-dependent methyltransferase